MSAQSTNRIDAHSTSTAEKGGERTLDVTLISFGYKQGPPPLANVVFDVRFLKNPFWVEDLRPLTGLDRPVQNYVLEQPLAQDFLQSIASLLSRLLPQVAEHKVQHYIIALGCTGGQHRSAALVEALAEKLKDGCPSCSITIQHRELCDLTKAKPETSGDASP